MNEDILNLSIKDLVFLNKYNLCSKKVAKRSFQNEAGMFFILIPLASMALLAWFFIFIMRRFAGKEEPEIKDAVTRLFDGLEGK